jgi:hypothetical protein
MPVILRLAELYDRLADRAEIAKRRRSAVRAERSGHTASLKGLFVTPKVANTNVEVLASVACPDLMSRAVNG